MADVTQERRGWDLSSTCCATGEAAEARGRAQALAETGARGLARVLAAQGRKRFGADNPAGTALLEALAAARAVERLQQLGETLLDASDWTAWLTGIDAPPPAPDDFPEFSVGGDVEIEIAEPSIEMTAMVGTVAGEKIIVQIRLQKWYQPDLGAYLYKEACRIETKHHLRPRIVIILMWPSADGPGVSGHYRTRRKGRLIDFHYDVRRAWEMAPEEVMGSPGTMVLTPLTKGAKERMPELIGLMKSRLPTMDVEPTVLEALWSAVYWSMGMVCPVEECNAILGDLVPMIENTVPYKKVYGEAFRQGYAEALNDGPILAIRDLVIRQATRRFGDDSSGRSAVDRVVSLHDLERIAGRIPTATNWGDLIGSATVPG